MELIRALPKCVASTHLFSIYIIFHFISILKPYLFNLSPDSMHERLYANQSTIGENRKTRLL